MVPFLLLAAGLAILVLAARIGSLRTRGITQGCGALLAAMGGLLLLLRRGDGVPGYGPRRWHQP